MYCLDTYALMEIYKGNPAYAGFMHELFVVPDPTLAEYYWVMLRETTEAEAETWKDKLYPFTVPVGLETLLQAVKFRHAHRKEGLSFFDAVGYLFSQKNGHEFVTGDKAFKGMKGVKFVK